MCGIYGTTKVYAPEILEKKMARTRFRGPDATACRDFDGVTLGHNRLAIIDLDPRANQPFCYRDLVVVHNGEIYNFRALREQLEAKDYVFKTTSDTEVLCAAYLEWGEDCVRHFNGMFAFVVLDRRKKVLFGARDRLGQKPLYYSTVGGFEFSSQIAEISIGQDLTIDNTATSQFLRFKYIPEPASIYREVKKLPCAHTFTYSLEHKTFSSRPYWDITENSTVPQFETYEEARRALKGVLREAVRSRLFADVPVGVFLSGGVDSSLIAALAREQSSQRVKTFSVRFKEDGFDESSFARQVAGVLDTDHTEIPCSHEEGLSLIDRLHEFYDEPFSDASMIPSLLLAKHTRKYVTVALSGDAGDESFLGYSLYDRALRFEKLYRVPKRSRIFLAALLGMVPGRKLRGAGRSVLTSDSVEALHYRAVSMLDDSWLLDPSAGDARTHCAFLRSDKPLLERLSDFDLKTYLPGDINVKVDRASMAFSLEARAPLEDHRVVEFGRALPTAYKWRGKTQKYILKDILGDFVPRSIIERPKRGFGMPLAVWFRGKLKPFVTDMLSPSRLRCIPNIRPEVVNAMLKNHLEGRENNYAALWSLVVLSSWLMRRQEGAV